MDKQLALFNEIPSQKQNKETPKESNSRFCKDLEELLITLGFIETDNNNPDKNQFKKRAQYKDMYDSKRHSAFLLNHNIHGLLRIEAHRQVQSGSVDQKFPFFLESLKNAPEKKAILVFEGNGYKKEAFKWLLDNAEKTKNKKINVFGTIDTFIDYIKC
ncbi:hypothetical protein CJF42_16225 [Pseudoalteromonas sp. NBT06-2]|uniref:PD-(D/E)XK nuclease superfamily protein n=1 Tax=Pseudoalteromonas sp. NBT06-2 TaxID=2025950 RepID=UPI000BA78EBC|nr:PD-(D/E)XK nuclease superfamily protein [Pseudoalteromonas sp. NBT06-2]PAJ73337.1 hypothetical protein CJF42_16225 [Pseudoalteromonas sp. NBT06-2]